MKHFYIRILTILCCLTLCLAGCKPAEVSLSQPPSPSALQTQQPPIALSPESSQPWGQDDWKLDESILTDDYLLDLVIGLEIGLDQVGGEQFLFDERQSLSQSQLYLAFLLLSDYDELEAKYRNQDDGMFYFTNDTITAQLSKYFKNISFDITQNPAYHSEANAIVTPIVSGFGGERYMELVDKVVNGNIVTFTAAFYEDYELKGNVYQTKAYGIEFYDGGYYYLYAVEV